MLSWSVFLLIWEWKICGWNSLMQVIRELIYFEITALLVTVNICQRFGLVSSGSEGNEYEVLEIIAITEVSLWSHRNKPDAWMHETGNSLKVDKNENYARNKGHGLDKCDSSLCPPKEPHVILKMHLNSYSKWRINLASVTLSGYGYRQCSISVLIIKPVSIRVIVESQHPDKSNLLLWLLTSF